MPATSLSTLPIGRAVRRFLDTESAGGILLVVATLAAFVWANVPGSHAYDVFWSTRLTVGIGGHVVSMDLKGWVDDGLFTVFFLTVGLELKRELVVGELRDPRTAVLPILAAAGGMAGSALVYFAFTAGTAAAHGWGIPMATDLALALGVLSLLGDRVNSSVKLFVLALAVADDLGSIVVLALFYERGFSVVALLVAIGLVGVGIGLRAIRVGWVPLYILVGLGMWLALYKAGISPTLAGVIMGLLAPTRARLSGDEIERRADELADVSSAGAVLSTIRIARRSTPTAERLELVLHPWSSFFAVPLFAFANAGIPLGRGTLGHPQASRVFLAVLAAKLVGKFVGVVAVTLLARAIGIGRLPEGMDRRDVLGIGVLTGVGLTVSFLVANLAFVDVDLENAAKLAVLGAAVITGAAAAAILYRPARAEPSR